MSNEKETLHIQKGVGSVHDGRKLSPRRKKYVKKNKPLNITEMSQGILNGDQQILSKAITLIESKHEQDKMAAQKLLQTLLNHETNSIRIGISGVPGSGKSTFIERFGLMLCELGYKVAVLAIDPSSTLTGGSVLGDKTRMEKLSSHEHAFIRPSPTSGTLGGVHQKTRETIRLCEAGGYEIILIETVGVGQSEIAVRHMVDFFILLVLTGAGDELQGMKKGIMEMTDLIVVHKADGDNKRLAKRTVREYKRILHLLQPRILDWEATALPVSSLEKVGHERVWDNIQSFVKQSKNKGHWKKRREKQHQYWFDERMKDGIIDNFFKKAGKNSQLTEMKKQIEAGEITVMQAVLHMLEE